MSATWRTGSVAQNNGSCTVVDPIEIGTYAIGQVHENVHGACPSDCLAVDPFIEEVEHAAGKSVGLVQLWTVGGLADFHELRIRESSDEFSALIPDSGEVEFSDCDEDRNLDARHDWPRWRVR